MSNSAYSIKMLQIAGIWAIWYGWAIIREFIIHRRTKREPVQLQITDIWATMPCLIVACYITFSRYTNNALKRSVSYVWSSFVLTQEPSSAIIDIPTFVGIMLIASQFAGLFILFLQLSRIRSLIGRASRALTIFGFGILHMLCCCFILLFAFSILSGSGGGYCDGLIFALLILGIFQLRVN